MRSPMTRTWKWQNTKAKVIYLILAETSSPLFAANMDYALQGMDLGCLTRHFMEIAPPSRGPAERSSGIISAVRRLGVRLPPGAPQPPYNRFVAEQLRSDDSVSYPDRQALTIRWRVVFLTGMR